MSHSTSQYVKLPAIIGTPGSAGRLATARTLSTAGKAITAGPPATAFRKEQQKHQQYHWLLQEYQQ
jgi:hypothetical protein